MTANGFDYGYQAIDVTEQRANRRDLGMIESLMSAGHPQDILAYLDQSYHLIQIDPRVNVSQPITRSQRPFYTRTAIGLTFGNDNDWFREQSLLWSPDGQRLLGCSPYGLYLLDPVQETVCHISLAADDTVK